MSDYLESLVVVLAAEFNVVLRQRLWRRALLSPFTDNVDLTHVDKHAYTSYAYATAQRQKGFETIDVAFHEGPGRSPSRPDDSAQ